MSTDPEILEIFHNEAKELLENIESELVQLEEFYSKETVNSLFRYFHTLKGSSGIAGLVEVSEFTHEIETLLDKFRNDEVGVTSELIDAILGSIDLIKIMIFSPESVSIDFEDKKNILIATINSASGEASSHSPVSIETSDSSRFSFYRIKIKFREDIFEFGIDPLMILEDIVEIGELLEFKVDRSALPSLEKMDPQKCYLSWFIVVKTKEHVQKLDEIFLFVRDDNTIEVTDVSSQYQEDLSENVHEDKKLGEILIKKGLITEDELMSVLNTKAPNQQLGKALVKSKLVTEADIQNALGLQVEVRKKIESATIRVETNKLDNLLNLLGEIVIGQSSISRFVEELDDDKAYAMKNSLYALNRSTRQFQEQIMQMRMIPIGPTFSQFKRFVRDTARQNGKEIKLVTRGNETELDKTVVEEITDPLKHMIRNAIDHGIESTEERMKCGKVSSGTITLNAYHQEGSIFIEVSDDGKGLDAQRIREVAVDKGVVAKDKELTIDETYSLIFKPGFSTSQAVGDLSGRGVGMDVVKSNIDSLRGAVKIISRQGEGTTFRVKLPLTLAIIDGMLIRVGSHVYIIPLLSIIESIQPTREDVKTIKGQGEVVMVRNEYVPLLRLHDYFDLEPVYQNPWEALLVIVESNGEKLAVMIDDLIGQQQIVIKSLDSYITSNKSVSGAAILGDGDVALILDIHGLLTDISYDGVDYASAEA